MTRKPARKLLLSVSVAAALGCSLPGSAFANGDPIEALEARIAELESLVQQLLEERQRAPALADSQTVEERAGFAAEEKVNQMLDEYRRVEEEQALKHSFAVGGYVKADISYSDYGGGAVASDSAGRDFYIAGTMPVGSGGESYLDYHMKESRINFKSTHLLDSGDKLGTFVEMDFLLSGQGDERISNSYSPRVRHAFFTYNNSGCSDKPGRPSSTSARCPRIWTSSVRRNPACSDARRRFATPWVTGSSRSKTRKAPSRPLAEAASSRTTAMCPTSWPATT